MPRLPVVPDVGAYVREQRVAARLSLRQLAQRAGMSNPYLSQIERGLRKPSAEILSALADALDVSAETLYVRAGILEEVSRETTVVAAIGSDPRLTEAQKRSLTDLYRLFVGQPAPEDVAAGRGALLGAAPPEVDATPGRDAGHLPPAPPAAPPTAPPSQCVPPSESVPPSEAAPGSATAEGADRPLTNVIALPVTGPDPIASHHPTHHPEETE